jgi:hypothetical protein
MPRWFWPDPGVAALLHATRTTPLIKRTTPALVAGARLALGVTDDGAVYVVASPNGDPFETWFDTLPFDAERTNRLVDACGRHFQRGKSSCMKSMLPDHPVARAGVPAGLFLRCRQRSRPRQ